MQITSIDAHDIVPIKRFQIAEMTDLVVIAGANGVGKTRLINGLLAFLRNPSADGVMRLTIEATSQSEQREWRKKELDTVDPQDNQLLQKTLQVNRRRNNMKSTVLHFESNRTFQQVKALQYQFEFPDPLTENVGWDITYGGLTARAQDTQHAILKKIQVEENKIAKKAVGLKKSGKLSMPLDFEDPLDMFRGPFSSLLAPKRLESADLQQQKLFYSDGGERLSFESLSSGEREVVNIVFDFILRNPNHSIVIFDEPELHLHPELVQKLIQTLRSIGESNQFIFCTHSPSVIATSLEHTVAFVSPPKPDASNQAVIVEEGDQTYKALRLLGQSVGVITLGSKIVLIEGDHSSLDKNVYSALVREKHPDLVLVPSEGKETIKRFAGVVGDVLDKSIWGVEFFMLCDRDATPTNLSLPEGEPSHSNLKVLKRYHLENYFLDENVLAQVFEDMEAPDSWLRSPDRIQEKLRELGKTLVSYAVALKISSQFRFEAGNIDIMVKGAHDATLDDLCDRLADVAASENVRISDLLDEDKIREATTLEYNTLMDSLNQGNDEVWKVELPGRPLLKKFAGAANLNIAKLKQMYLNKALQRDPNPFQEIMDLFAEFASNSALLGTPVSSGNTATGAHRQDTSRTA